MAFSSYSILFVTFSILVHFHNVESFGERNDIFSQDLLKIESNANPNVILTYKPPTKQRQTLPNNHAWGTLQRNPRNRVPDKPNYFQLSNKTDIGLQLGTDYFEVEVNVIIDSKLYESININEKFDVIQYISIFFNGVNHIYTKSHPFDPHFPKVVVKVVDITKLEDVIKEADLFKKPDDENDPDIIDIQQVLKRLRKSMKNSKYDKYDHIMLLTGRDLYRKKDNGPYQPDVLGAAYLGGACKKSTDGKNASKSVSVVEDVGALFFGVYPAAHELAHNLGSKHDKGECFPQDGYIMSPMPRFTSNMFTFSECSLKSLENFLRSEEGPCLKEGSLKPIDNGQAESRLPGDVFTMDELCQGLGEIYFLNEVTIQAAVNPSKTPSELCKHISCKITTSASHPYTLQPSFPPGENVPCGKSDAGKCKRGECIYGVNKNG